jgi:hypothetical protein
VPAPLSIAHFARVSRGELYQVAEKASNLKFSLQAAFFSSLLCGNQHVERLFGEDRGDYRAWSILRRASRRVSSPIARRPFIMRITVRRA